MKLDKKMLGGVMQLLVGGLVERRDLKRGKLKKGQLIMSS